MKNKKLLAVIAVCVAGVVAFAMLGATSADSGADDEEVVKDIVVDTMNPSIGDIVVSGEYIGRVEPNQQVYVLPKLAGEVLSVEVSVGDYVEEGQILAQIDAAALEAQVNQTAISLAQAEKLAALNREMAQQNKEVFDKNADNGNALLQYEVNVQLAETGLSAANLQLATARRSYSNHLDKDEDEYNYIMSGGMSDYAYKDASIQYRDAIAGAELAVEQAELALQQAKEAYEVAKSSIEDQEFSVNSNVTLAELNSDFSDSYIALNKLRDDLGNAIIRAPISGLIEARNVDPFDIASSASPAFIISNKDSMTVSFQVPETSLGSVRLGDRITVEKNGATATGVVTEIGTMVSSGGLFTVKASVADSAVELHTGSTIKVYVDNQRSENTIIMPINSIYYDGGESYVYVADNGIARKRIVETGIYDASTIEILSGLSLSDQVIVTWNANMEDGSVIRLQGEPVVPAEVSDEAASEESSTEDPSGEVGKDDITEESTNGNGSDIPDDADEIGGEESDSSSEDEEDAA